MNENHTYSASGVDVASGNQASEILYNAAQLTWKNRKGKIGEIKILEQHFRTSRYFIPPRHDGLCFGINFDGIGTKVEVAERLNSYSGLAQDLMAMTCDDAAVQGAEPILFGSIIDTANVNLEIIGELANGLVEAASKARVAVINGELAELPGRIGGFGTAPFNWGGACLWAATENSLQTWSRPLPGDAVIGIAENGFRSNGYSLVRAIFRSAFGEMWGVGSNPAGGDLIQFAIRPSTIYTPFLLSLTGGVSGDFIRGLRSAFHVTGGGLMGRCQFFCKQNKIGISMNSLSQPPEEMCQICELGNVDLAESYNTWNMGVGLIVIASRDAATSIIDSARLFDLRASVIGTIISEPYIDLNTYVGIDLKSGALW